MNIFVFKKKTLQPPGHIDAAAEYFAKKLGIINTKTELYITLKSGNMLDTGRATCIDDGMYGVDIFIPLSQEELYRTLAHEMVHVKQMIRNEFDPLISQGPSGEPVFLWHRQPYPVTTECGPWEVEAYQRETQLYTDWLKHFSL